MSGWSRDQGAQERERETVREAREQPRGEAPATGLFRGLAPSDPAGDLGATTTHEHHVSASLPQQKGRAGHSPPSAHVPPLGEGTIIPSYCGPARGEQLAGRGGSWRAGKGVAGT